MSHLSLRELFLGHNAQTSSFPLLLEYEKAEGVYLIDKKGDRCIDLISGIGVSTLGHGNEEVKKAVHEQVERYMHLMVYGEFVQAPQVRFAESLCAHLPDKLNSVYFVNSGSEAADGAIKLAKRATGRKKIFSFQNSYHGSGQGPLSLMGNDYYKKPFEPLLPGVAFLDLNEGEQLNQIDDNTACVILETIQGEAGIRIPEQAYLSELRKVCTEKGVLLILDEIQCGMGRTGKLFAFEHYGVVPDILLLAKSLGGGMPLGAFISSAELMGTLKESPVLGHITTFGGHPVCCAAGLAAFSVLIREKLTDTVEEKSRLFCSLLSHPAILEIRRKGLLIALEFNDFDQNKRIIDACIAKGVMVDWFLHNARSMRICPPLVITEEEIRAACVVILEAIDLEYKA